jgi:hypothetical protein
MCHGRPGTRWRRTPFVSDVAPTTLIDQILSYSACATFSPWCS